MTLKTASFRKIILFFVVVILSTAFVNCGPQNPRSEARKNRQEGWIGVYAQDLDQELRRYMDIDDKHGVLVNEVLEDSPAEDAGIREEDVITRFDGKRIRDMEDLTRAVKRKEPGDKVKVEIVRDNEKKTVKLRVGEKPESSYSYRTPSAPRPPQPPTPFSFREGRRVWLGIQMTDLNRDLAEYFGVREKEGVLILSVADDSPAARAGLRAGDVILEIDGDAIRDKEDLIDAISEREAGEEIEIKYQRKGDTETVRVKLERTSYNSSFHFDKDALREWQHDLDEWKHEFKDWQADLDLEELEHLNVDFEINIPVKELERELEHLGEDLEREMENLSRELEKLHIEIKVDGREESI